MNQNSMQVAKYFENIMNNKQFKILIGFTGSVASIKSQDVINEIKSRFND